MENPGLTGAENICAFCHYPVQTEFYFCPNCGTNIKQTPLSISAWAQIKLYTFSVILPMICFITIWRWKGGRYLRSKDQTTRTIGIVACLLLVLSTVVTIWVSVITAEKFLQLSTMDINTVLENY